MSEAKINSNDLARLDELAKFAMMGLLSWNGGRLRDEDVAKQAYTQAVAMLKIRQEILEEYLRIK